VKKAPAARPFPAPDKTRGAGLQFALAGSEADPVHALVLEHPADRHGPAHLPQQHVVTGVVAAGERAFEQRVDGGAIRSGRPAHGSAKVVARERDVTPEEIGRPLSATSTGLGLCIYRKGKRYGFWQPEAQSLKAGDKIIEVVPFDGPRS
jgi:hypothetical protein